MKEQIYQNGFYFLLGIMLTALFNWACSPKYDTKENSIRIEVIKDSVKVHKDSIKAHSIPKNLTVSNLKAELDKNKIPHSNIVLAQAKLETGNFKSDLVHTHQNIFGLKKGNRYRKYSHWTECVADYKKCISSRYNGGDYYNFLNRIGYADNPNYTNLLKELV